MMSCRHDDDDDGDVTPVNSAEQLSSERQTEHGLVTTSSECDVSLFADFTRSETSIHS